MAYVIIAESSTVAIARDEREFFNSLGSLSPRDAKALSVSLETLMGEPQKAAKKRGPTPTLALHMERISQLPKPQQRFVVQVLESVLAQAASR